MNVDQVVIVLSKAAAFDNRSVGEANIEAWYEVLYDVEFRDALDAVAQHFRDHADVYLMPAHIRRYAAEAERDRRRAARELNEAEAAALEAIERGPLRDRSEDVQALLRELRDRLRNPGPDILRRAEWVEHDRRRALDTRPDAQPNPHYDPTLPPPSEVEEPQ